MRLHVNMGYYYNVISTLKGLFIMKILVTGGMGFVGNHLVRKLLDLGHEVIVLDKSIYTPLYYAVEEATIIDGDILSTKLVRSLLDSVDVCVHLAAISSVPLSNRDWMFSHETNVVGFNGILNELMQVNRHVKCIYASSAAIYGYHHAEYLSESLKVTPVSTYGVDKFSNELYALAINRFAGVATIGLRFFNIYGPGQLEGNPYSGVITHFRNALLEQLPLTIHGDGSQSRDFIFIDDVINAILIAIDTPEDFHGVFNICTGKTVTIKELATLMMRLMNSDEPIHFLPERVGDVRQSCGDPALAKQMLSFEATTRLEEGLSIFLGI